MTAPATSRPGFWTWTGIAVVGVASAVLSFASLRDLAISCRVSPTLAPLLPIVIDAGLALNTRAWLSRRSNSDAERYARRMTWALLGLTVAANAGHQGMVAHGVTPPWPVAVLVGAIAPAVLGAVVHLATLLGRVQAPAEAALIAEPALEQPTRQVTPRPAGSVSPEKTVEKPKVPADDDLAVRARQVIAHDPTIGRNHLAKALGIKPYRARVLLEELNRPATNGHAVLETA